MTWLQQIQTKWFGYKQIQTKKIIEQEYTEYKMNYLGLKSNYVN